MLSFLSDFSISAFCWFCGSLVCFPSVNLIPLFLWWIIFLNSHSCHYCAPCPSLSRVCFITMSPSSHGQKHVYGFVAIALLLGHQYGQLFCFAIYNNGQQQQWPTTTTANGQPPPTTANHRQPPPTTANHRQPPPTTANHCQPPPTTANHRQPPPTTANHRRPPPTTANHRRPPPTLSKVEPTIHHQEEEKGNEASA
jgi:hypothetical protein